MQITSTFDSTKSFPLDQNLIDLGKRVLTTNMGLKPTESLLIVTDPNMENQEAALWFEAGKTITPNTTMIVFEGMTEHAQEPPEKVVQLMESADVAMLQTTFSLSHTKARKQATNSGTRIASLPEVTLDIINRTVNMDYTPIAKLSEQVVTKLSQATKVHITSPGGTDLYLEIDPNRPIIPDTGFFTKPGEFGNLPAGETFVAPIETKTNGVYVVDGSFTRIELDQPVTITVKDGLATDITGGIGAQQLIDRLAKVDPSARTIGELGFGTNPNSNPKGSLIEAEKAYGTIHIALGNNVGFGGTISVPFHSDGVILSPTVTLDNQIIIKDGKYQL